MNAWSRWSLGFCALLVAGAFAQRAEATLVQDVKAEIQMSENDVHTLLLEDLKDGESRTFTDDNHTVVVTRRGDRFTLQFDGEDVSLDSSFHHTGSHPGVFSFTSEGGSEGHHVVWTDKVEGNMTITSPDEKGGAFWVDEGEGLVELTEKEDGHGYLFVNASAIQELDLGDGRTVIVSFDGERFSVRLFGPDLEFKFPVPDDGASRNLETNGDRYEFRREGEKLVLSLNEQEHSMDLSELERSAEEQKKVAKEKIHKRKKMIVKVDGDKKHKKVIIVRPDGGSEKDVEIIELDGEEQTDLLKKEKHVVRIRIERRDDDEPENKTITVEIQGDSKHDATEGEPEENE